MRKIILWTTTLIIGVSIINTHLIYTKENTNLMRDAICYECELTEEIVNGTYSSDDKKVAFLTFDDGPSSKVTPKILDYLKEKNIKATFFVLGKSIDENKYAPEILTRMINEGHVIGNHTYNHNYNKLYPKENTDVKVFMKEIDKTNESIKKALCSDCKINLIRMPYGYITRVNHKDKNIKTLKKEIQKRDMYILDWNCLTLDAIGKKKTPDELLMNLKKSSKNKKKLVILMHDSNDRKSTYEGLPKIVEYLEGQGYEFAIFNNK